MVRKNPDMTQEGKKTSKGTHRLLGGAGYWHRYIGVEDDWFAHESGSSHLFFLMLSSPLLPLAWILGH